METELTEKHTELNPKMRATTVVSGQRYFSNTKLLIQTMIEPTIKEEKSPQTVAG